MFRFARRAERSIRRHLGFPSRVQTGLGKGLRFSAKSRDALFLCEDYELPIQEALASVLEPGGVFYDVGSNLGFFALIAARIVGPRGVVYSFEPVQKNAREIEENAAANGLKNISVIDLAVSDKSGMENLYLAEYGGGSSLSSAGVPPDMINETCVKTITLDEFASQSHIRPPDLVKIDVEGAELKVLIGMVALLLGKRPVLVVEFDDSELAKCEQKLNSAQQFVEGRGYRTTVLPNCYSDGGWFVRHIVCTPAQTNY